MASAKHIATERLVPECQNLTMPLGRTDERLAIDRLLTQARTGDGGVLALVGEPGIGKTAMLDYAAVY
jgi:hypothetical protein